MTEKALIFDASSLITITMSGLLPEFIELKKIFGGKFIMPEEVKKEVIDRPMKIKRFELEALKIKDLLDKKILELPEAIGIKTEKITSKTNELMIEINNSFFQQNSKPIELIHSGETACLALGLMTEIKNLIVIDERTTRLIVEKPQNLQKILRKKLHTEVTYKKEKLEKFNKLNIVRSSELMYLAHKKGLTKIKGNKILDAILYALKYKGCAISFDEIEKIKRIKC